MAWALTTAARSGQHCWGPCWGQGQCPPPRGRPRQYCSLAPPFSRRLFPPPEAPPHGAITQAPPQGREGHRAPAEAVCPPPFAAPAQRAPVRGLLEATIAVGDLASFLGERERKARPDRTAFRDRRSLQEGTFGSFRISVTCWEAVSPRPVEQCAAVGRGSRMLPGAGRSSGLWTFHPNAGPSGVHRRGLMSSGAG